MLLLVGLLAVVATGCSRSLNERADERLRNASEIADQRPVTLADVLLACREIANHNYDGMAYRQERGLPFSYWGDRTVNIVKLLSGVLSGPDEYRAYCNEKRSLEV